MVCREETRPAPRYLAQREIKASVRFLPLLEEDQLGKTDSGYIEIRHIGKRLIDWKTMKPPDK